MDKWSGRYGLKGTIVSVAIDGLIPKVQSGDVNATSELVGAIKDDIYNLAMRMLGSREDAEDATQEILINVLSGLPGFREESSFRTWVWRLATNHILRFRRAVREKTCSFEALDAVLSLRTVFELDSQQASEILEISPVAFRKRLQRARSKLDGWMKRQCGLVNASAGCSCIRKVTLAIQDGHIDPGRLMYSHHPTTENPGAFLGRAAVRRTTSELDAFARELTDHPDYAAGAAGFGRSDLR